MLLVTLARSALTGWALEMALPDLWQGGRAPNVSPAPRRPAVDERLVGIRALRELGDLVAEFNRLADQLTTIAGRLDPSADQHVLVVVDYIRPHMMCAYADSATWDNLVAALILAFPDVAWCFALVAQASDEATTADASPMQRLPFPGQTDLRAALANEPLEPLYDGAGLRAFVRMTQPGRRRRGSFCGDRSERAAVIDDEPSIAHFHAYCAYRFGYRVEVVTSMRAMHDLFDAPPTPPAAAWAVTLEDMSLGFPGQGGA